MKVSIITACINLIKEERDEYFKQMFKSDHAQTYTDIEHIIIDGASQDGTVEFIQEIIQNATHPTVFISEPDTGIYNAMNKGVKHSKGDSFIIMNSDDYYYSNKAIEDLAQPLINNNQLGFVTAKCQILRHQDDKRRDKIASTRPNNFIFHMPFSHNTMLCKTSLFDELGGFDEEYRCAADYDLVFKLLAKHTSNVTIDNIVTAFREEGNTHQFRAESIADTLAIMKNYYPDTISDQELKRIHQREIGWGLYKKICQFNFSIKPQFKKQIIMNIPIVVMKNCLTLLKLNKS